MTVDPSAPGDSGGPLGSGRPGGPAGNRVSSQGPGGGTADDSRAEAVLSQALRAMAGGQSQPTAAGGRAAPRLSTGQLVLIAAIIGLLVGIGAGLLSLLL